MTFRIEDPIQEKKTSRQLNTLRRTQSLFSSNIIFTNFRHMKKSRKDRGREFRAKINAKFGFKPSVVRSDTESDNEVDTKETSAKKGRIGKFTF